MKRKKENARRSERRADSTAMTGESSNTHSSESQASSWRDGRQIYPAADDYPLLEDAELKALAKRIEESGLRVPIQTRSVASEDRPYVIDGRNRLDAMEKVLGWQIVNEKGEWHGALALTPGTKPQVEHKQGCTHEQIIAEIDDLNFHRRHLNESQRALLAAKRATATRGGDYTSEQSANLRKAQMTQAEAAERFKVSRRSVQTAAKVMSEAPEKAEAVRKGKKTVHKAASEIEAKKQQQEQKGKLLNGEDAAERFDPEEFKKSVWKGWCQLLKRFDQKRRLDVQREIVNQLFGLSHSAKASAVPEHVIYEDGTKFAVEKVLQERHLLRLKTDKRKPPLQPVKSYDLTEAVIGQPSKKKGGAK